MTRNHGFPSDERSNPYPGLIDDWKVQLVRRRARQLGFRRHELGDALEELILPILQFRFDPDRSHGASEKTALCALIDHQLKALVRKQARYRKHVKALCQSRTPLKRCRKHVLPSTADFSSPGERMEFAELLAPLSSEQHQVCLALIDGHSIAQIAESLGCSWHRINRIIDQVRHHLRQQGVRGVQP